MERQLHIPNIISAKDAAMLSAYGESAQSVLIDIFNKIKEATQRTEKSISLPIIGHSIWALKKYLTTFGYTVQPKINIEKYTESIIIISWK